MSTQNVDFEQSGATADTGEKEAAAIRPVLDGEPGIQATFQRPSENLRTRTEIIRDEIEALKYLADADRGILAYGGGNLLWDGVSAGGGDGTFTITQDLTIRPFLSPATSTKAKAIIRGVSFETQLAGPVVPRSYSGANKISVRLEGSNGAVLGVVISGTPADNVTITVNTHPSSGTSKQELIDYLTLNGAAGPVAYRALGLTAALETGAVGTDKVNDTGVWTYTGLTPDEKLFAGGADAEKHTITATGLATFFADPLNAMAEGDVLAIWYDELVNGSYGGRRESMSDLPENSANVDNNIFLLRRYPERMPLALPVATILSDQVRLIDGSILPKGTEVTLTGGLPGLPPPQAEPPARFLRMDPGGTHYWGTITADLIVEILAISAFSANAPSVEVGTVVSTPAFSASYTQGPPTTATLTKDLLGSPELQSLTPPATSFSATAPPANYQKLDTNELVRFRLTADAGDTPDTADTDITWRRYFYFGKNASAAPTINEDFIRAAVPAGQPGLDVAPGDKALTAGRAHTFTMTGLVNEYVYFAYANSHGALTGLRDNVAGFDIDFVDMGTVAAVATENGAGNATTYRVYRSVFPQTGSINFTSR